MKQYILGNKETESDYRHRIFKTLLTYWDCDTAKDKYNKWLAERISFLKKEKSE